MQDCIGLRFSSTFLRLNLNSNYRASRVTDQSLFWKIRPPTQDTGGRNVTLSRSILDPRQYQAQVAPRHRERHLAKSGTIQHGVLRDTLTFPVRAKGRVSTGGDFPNPPPALSLDPVSADDSRSAPLPLIPQQFSLVGLIGGPFEAEGRFPLGNRQHARHRQDHDIALAAAVVRPRSRESWRRGAA